MHKHCIFRYVFVYSKSYQETDTADSSVVVKVKGMLERDTPNGVEIWDSSDFVVPTQVYLNETWSDVVRK